MVVSSPTRLIRMAKGFNSLSLSRTHRHANTPTHTNICFIDKQCDKRAARASSRALDPDPSIPSTPCSQGCGQGCIYVVYLSGLLLKDLDGAIRLGIRLSLSNCKCSLSCLHGSKVSSSLSSEKPAIRRLDPPSKQVRNSSSEFYGVKSGDETVLPSPSPTSLQIVRHASTAREFCRYRHGYEACVQDIPTVLFF